VVLGGTTSLGGAGVDEGDNRAPTLDADLIESRAMRA